MIMEVVPYTHKEEELELVNSWLLARGQTPIDPKTIPKIGFFAICEGEKIACSFLRRVEGKYAMFDGLTTNPKTNGFLTHAALGLLNREICLRAKSLGILAIIGHTTDKSTLERSKRWGYRQLPGVLVGKDLL